jgi:hypothetical protein
VAEATTKPVPLRRGDFYHLEHLDPEDEARVLRYPSVTTVLSEVAKPALTMWAAKEAAAAALADPYLSVNEAAAAIYSKRDRAADRGSFVHGWIEALSQGHEGPEDMFPEDLQPWLTAFRKWNSAAKPTFVYSELVVVNHTYGYAGTLDAIIRDQGGRTGLIDYKTGKGVYDEASYQLSAYRHGEQVLDRQSSVTYSLPQIDFAGVVHLKGDGTWTWYEMRDDFETFLAYLHLWNRRRDRECRPACPLHSRPVTDHAPALSAVQQGLDV